MSDLKENFEEKVRRDGGRWLWTGSVNNDGYPKIKDNGKLRLASHVSLELAGRSAPEGKGVVMHKDNNPKNVAPSNLGVGTQPENLKQMRDEGRDRPRGVKQEPDVKTAGLLGVRRMMERGRADFLKERKSNLTSNDPHLVEYQRLVDHFMKESSGAQSLPSSSKKMVAMAQSVFSKKAEQHVVMKGFSDELQKIIRANF